MIFGLATGNADENVIDPVKPNIWSTAVLHDELYWDHSVSQPLSLRLEE